MSRVVPSPRGKGEKPRRKSSIVQMLLRPSSSTLDPDKFAELMSNDLASGFQETSESFEEITSKACEILDSSYCYIFLLDDNEHKLYTYVKDEQDREIKVMKPVDRGITGFVLSEEKGLNLGEARSSTQWCGEIDDFDHYKTESYLAFPLWDTMIGSCIGVVEFRNKNTRNMKFDAAAEQMAQIIAFQVGRAVVHRRQEELIDGRNKAITIAFGKKFDKTDSIPIEDPDIGNEVDKSPTTLTHHSGGINSLRRAMLKQRSAMTMSSSWKWKPPSNHSHLSDRDWGYDVFLCNEEQLIMHAVDIFDERGLFANYSIPVTTFVNFVKEIKAGYNINSPYHNHYHAFDVMHVCYLLITRCKGDEYLDSFNILSILVGALAHDLGHDGFNNAFHCTTNSELAVVYNGISVLENYSAAYLFRILRKDKCNIFARLSPSDMTKMRSRLIDLILDTDAKNHFTLMTRFKHSMEMRQLSRGLLSSMLLHVSDVSNPTRPGVIARKWAYAVQEEFFRQGDKEKQLQLATSPFMDREFENLPRMQGAFIDALVTPVFKLLAELLPLIKTHCINQLNSNRMFWSSMQNQALLTRESIISHLNGVGGDVSISEEEEETEEEPATPSTDAIPGIPANAFKGHDQETVRKLSLVSIQDQNISFDDLEQGTLSPMVDKKLIKKKACRQRCQQCFQDTKDMLTKMLDSATTQLILLIATITALLSNDLNTIFGNKSTDLGVDIMLSLVFFIFFLEIVVSIVCLPKYTHFFLWLDLAATISLLFEIDFFLEFGSSTTGDLSLAKASRAAKVGARAGRLAKLLRLLRLVKIVKVLKWMMGYKKKKEAIGHEDNDDEIGMKMSVVGRTMTESITKKVIVTVMFMLAVFSLLETNMTPDGRQLQLDALAFNPESDLLREGFFRAHENLLRLDGVGETYEDSLRIEELRSSEILTLTADINDLVSASFDMSKDMFVNALFSLVTTLIVTALLAVLSLLFSSDAYNIMIRPIEKMKSTVQKLSENPLLHLEKLKSRGESSESNETDLLEQTITKMATLLQVGFGCAGAEIIAKSLSVEGELDPMVPGNRVNAIFGFCDIRNFTAATEHLQQDVMLFVNKLAQITHRHVVDSGGAPNKNIGDAFLLVWKLTSGKNGARGKLQKHLFDSALSSLQNVIAEIKKIGSLADFMQKEDSDLNNAVSKLDDFKIEMGFGLHTGWAIEGSIGSKVKVDASYLSPHVNLASRLEAATKQYNTPLLMSDVFVSGLTGSVQSTCRRVDRVIFKGCIEPMTIFHQDIEPFPSLQEKPPNYSELLLGTSWDGEEEIKALGLDLSDIIKALQSDKTLLIREIYEIAFNAYVDGEWGKCKVLIHLWLEKFPGDVIVQVLAKFLMSFNFECPEKWEGHRILQTK